MLLKMNKQLFLLITFLLLFSSISYAQTCDVNNIKEVLKKNLYLFFTDPSSSPLTLNEVKDLLIFYLSVDENLITVDCSATGSRSNKVFSDIIGIGENATDTIPTCADGTKYGECSTFRPKYCYSGSLLHRCNYCGCPSASGCSTGGKCDAVTGNVTCSSDLDCGASGFIGNYYCSNNYVAKDYLNYTCLNAGTSSSSCVSETINVLINYCKAGEACVEGQSSCQLTGSCVPETLTLSFTSLDGVTTTNQYTGSVSVSVEGTGQSSGIAYNDAFYVYTSYIDGSLITPEVQDPFLLYIGGAPVQLKLQHQAIIPSTVIVLFLM